MANWPDKMSQRKAAEYLSSEFFPIDHTALSRLCKYGGGPTYTDEASRRVFYRCDLDDWAKEHLDRQGAERSA